MSDKKKETGKVIPLFGQSPASLEDARKLFISKAFSLLAAHPTGDAETDRILSPNTYVDWILDLRGTDSDMTEGQWDVIEAWGFTDRNHNIEQPYIDFIDAATPPEQETVGEYLLGDDVKITFSLGALGLKLEEIENFVQRDQLRVMDIDQLAAATTMPEDEIAKLRELRAPLLKL